MPKRARRQTVAVGKRGGGKSKRITTDAAVPIQAQLAADTGDVTISQGGGGVGGSTIGLLNYNQMPPRQTAIVSYGWQEVLPITRLPDPDSSVPLEFRFERIENSYTDFFGGFLDYSVSVHKLDVNNQPVDLVPADLVCPINLAGLTFFKKVELWAGDLQVLGHHSDFAYISYNSVLLYASEVAKSHALKSWGWYPDTPGFFNDVVPGNLATNKGAKDRMRLISESKSANFIVPLMFDLGGVKNLIPDRADLQLRYYRNTPEFWLMQPATQHLQFVVKLKQAKFHVARYQLAPYELARLTRTLNSVGFLSSAALLLVKRRTFLAGEQNLSFICFRDVLPAFIIPWFTSAAAANGDTHRNPVQYLNPGIRRIIVYKNDIAYPLSNGISFPDLTNQQLSYFNLLRNLHGGSPSFEPADMQGANGNNIFCFDMTAGNTSNGAVTSPVESGTIRIEVDLDAPLTENTILFVEGVFGKNVKITEQRGMEIEDAK